ncbi:nitrite/sulfite reductase [Heliorestis acidaminivorans]|uniref:Nitrite/sulfite reductase n=1 Tax=Heliorestis acidaminivorans TaxID=553427 RepID=A0A6I0F2L5_9FIRM|nr:nitrite/sulfite reductase [Heliorestis acidaminivorans]KAB2952713.1 nitrite/sulfite reductase [Heliorestis acidaminivorans]
MKATNSEQKVQQVTETIEEILRQGIASISDEEQKMLKKAGIYFHKPKEKFLLFLRVTLPAGILTSEQGKVLSHIANSYGKGYLSITTRQAIQIHNIKLEDMPSVLTLLQKAKLSSIGAGGDSTRNIVAPVLTGIDPQEELDCTELIKELYHFFQEDSTCQDLPRKFKIALSSSRVRSGAEGIHCLSFTAARQDIEGQESKGFHVHVGGGLSRDARVAQELDLFVLPHQVIDVAQATATLFQDYGCREDRKKARVKHLVERWGVEEFQQKLIKYLGYELPAKGQSQQIVDQKSFQYGLQVQKQKGYYYLAFHIPRGHLKATQLHELAKIADAYGLGELRLGFGQSMVIPHVPFYRGRDLVKEDVFQQLPIYPAPLTGQVLACTGGEYCKYSNVQTKERLYEIVETLDRQFKEEGIEVPPLRIHMVGCPHSCGHRHLADIGLQAKKSLIDGQVEEAFVIYQKNDKADQSELCTEEVAMVKAEDLLPFLKELIMVKLFQKKAAKDRAFAASGEDNS